MKLKKIASLALAGVMAVSMLAGCANKAPETGDGEGTQVEVATTPVADAMNAAGTKITFTEDADLAAALQKAINLRGYNASVTALIEEVIRQAGVGGTLEDLTNALDYNATTAFNSNDENQTIVNVEKYAASSYYNSEALVLAAAAQSVKNDAKYSDAARVDDDAAGLAPGAEYHKYSYTGKAAMVTVTDPTSGAITYVVVTAVTRTVTTDTLPQG